MSWIVKQTSAPVDSWTSITSSSDGTKLAASSDSVGTYTSSDSGDTWRQTSLQTTVFWKSITSSSDGAQIAAGSASGTGNLYLSQDSGLTWNPILNVPPGNNYSVYSTSMANNLDTLLTAVISDINSINSCYIYKNGNGKYINTPNNEFATFIRTSSNGLILATYTSRGFLYISNNLSTWTNPPTLSTSKAWTSITISADGTKLAASVYGGRIWISLNSGETWEESKSQILSWRSITSSADGTKLAACVYSGKIYTSRDYGRNWSVVTTSPTANWQTITSSVDGLKLVAAANSGYIYTITAAQAPITKFTVSNKDLNSIFQPYTTAKYYTDTGYKSNNIDLKEIFQVYDGTSIKAPITGYNVGNTDLNSIFQVI